MKTKGLVVAMLSAFVLSASAQNGSKTNFQKNKASDNWFITVGAGASAIFGDANRWDNLADRVNVTPQLSVGRWFNPYWGTRLQLTGGPFTNFIDQKGNNSYDAYWLNPHLDFMWDVTNFWAPYKEDKVFRFIPFAGFGYAVRTGKVAYGNDYKRSESMSINLGAIASFRLSKRIDLNLEGQYIMLQEHFNRMEVGHELDRMVQVTAGLNFKLGKTDFEVLQPTDYALLNDLNGQINALRSENEALSRRPASCPDCVQQPATVVNNSYSSENVVYFRMGSSVVDRNQEINIFNTAEFMKKNNVAIKVIGYADKGTGSSAGNMRLSERRARAVAKELVDKYGISSSQVTIEWKGSDVQPYSENSWNRVVIMTANK